MAARLKGWRFAIFIGSFVSAVGGTLYFSAVRPMIDPEPYKQVRETAVPQLRSQTPFK